MMGPTRTVRVAADLTILLFSSLVLFIIGTAIYNHSVPSTEVRNAHIVGPSTVYAGSIIRVEYDVIRYRNCRLDIARQFRRLSDRREFVAQTITMLILADDPPRPRPAGYNVRVPVELTTDEYDVFPRVRYYCSWLDEYDWSRIVDMPPVRIRVIGLEGRPEQPK